MNLIDTWFTNKNIIREEDTSSPSVLSKILETMREGVIVVGANTRILASNQAAYKAFARSNGSMQNKRISEVIRDLSLHEAFRKALEDGEASDIKLEIIGAERHKYDVHIAPLELDEVKSAVGVFYDITQIEHLEKVRQEFLSNISHELRTPLTSILAFVETLEDGAIDDFENNRRFLSVIRKNAERMHYLINDILELSSIESGKIRIEPKSVNLHLLIEEIFDTLSAKADERQILLINDVSPETFVYADLFRFEQMLMNLIDNAVKFNRPDGSVLVEHESKPFSDIIKVTDGGEGIPSEHLQRIFERFYRTDRARSREIGGTGLGLAIVKHLTRLHGGEVSVESIPNKGTTFSVELPKTL